jgi:hypothetical protein
VLKTVSEKIKNPQHVADRLNSVFIDCTEDLGQIKPYINGQTSQMKIKYIQILCLFTSNRRQII